MALKWADLTDDERWRLEIAVHEAGHAVACTLTGGRIAKAVLIDPPGGELSGETAFRVLAEGSKAQVFYGGPWCQARLVARKRPTAAQVRAVLDDSRDYTQLSLCGGTAAGAAVVQLLERTWPAIITAARQLHRDGEIDHHDVLAALQLTEQTAPMGLAAIRSGSTPGSFTITPAA